MAAILKIRYYGHHEYIHERLHIQKCFFGDSLHVCQIWCFYQKVHNFLVICYTTRDEVMLNSEENKPIALAVIELRLSEGISQIVSQ